MIPELRDNSNGGLIGSEHTLMSTHADDRATKRQKGHDELPTSVHNNRQPLQKSLSFAPITQIYSSDVTREEVERSWYTVSYSMEQSCRLPLARASNNAFTLFSRSNLSLSPLSPPYLALQKEELASLKLERKSLVKALKKVRFDLSQVNTRKHCLRGFEAYFSVQCNKEYKMKRQMVWDSVFQEQSRQRYLGINDTTMMQLVSSHATQWARDIAYELGMKDAQVALDVFMEFMNEQQQQQQQHAQQQEEELELDFEDADFEPIQISYKNECNSSSFDYQQSHEPIALDASSTKCNCNLDSKSPNFQLPASLNCSHFGASELSQRNANGGGPVSVLEQLEAALRLT